MVQNLKLQPLRVPAGWRIDWNTFFDIELSENTISLFQGSSLLSASYNDKYFLELVFYPEGDIEGEFILNYYTFKRKIRKKKNINNEDVECIGEFKNKSKDSIVREIERFMNEFDPDG